MPSLSARNPHDAANTRTAILEAAAALYAEHGFDGTTTADIALRARANKAMIHYHFGTKDGLYREILATGVESLATAVASVRNAGDPPEEQLRGAIHAWVGVASRHPHLPMLLMREFLSGGAHLDDALLPRFLSVFGNIREILEEGIRKRRFRRIDPFLTHLSLGGSIVFFFVSMPFRERLAREGRLPFATPSTDRFASHLCELFATGLGSGTPERRRTNARSPRARGRSHAG
jgi:AcrR family transcriptional regulator